MPTLVVTPTQRDALLHPNKANTHSSAHVPSVVAANPTTRASAKTPAPTRSRALR